MLRCLENFIINCVKNVADYITDDKEKSPYTGKCIRGFSCIRLSSENIPEPRRRQS